MFNDQVIRLLREKWANATLLAEELFAMFLSDKPTVTKAPLEIQNQPGGLPGLTMKKATNNPDEPLAAFTKPNGDTITLGIAPDGSTVEFTGPDGQWTQPVDPDKQILAGGNCFWGKVVSGSGDTYTVEIFPNGEGRGSKKVSVKQGLIASDDKIDAGHPCLVVKAGNKYYMQVPVWVK